MNIKGILATNPVAHNLNHKIVVKRWDMMNIPLHCLAYVLVLNTRVLGFQNLLRRVWRKSHCDLNVQKGYLDAIDKMIMNPSEMTYKASDQ